MGRGVGVGISVCVSSYRYKYVLGLRLVSWVLRSCGGLVGYISVDGFSGSYGSGV